MAGNLFVISDMHWYHEKVLEFGPRPFDTVEECVETMVELWNNVVDKRDTVLCLGDVGMSVRGYDVFKRCNGYIRLIMGNHDKGTLKALLNKNIQTVHGSFQKKDILFTHMPTMLDPYHPKIHYVVHGHWHGTHQKVDDIRYYNANCDHQQRWEPISLEEIKQEFARRKFQRLWGYLGEDE